MDVRYEDLVIDPEHTVRKICAFLREEFEPAMLEVGSRVGLVPLREEHVHRKLAKPISADMAAVWRTRLTWRECFMMEACLQRDLRRLGYPLRYSSIGWRPLLVMSGGILRLSAAFLIRAIPYLKRLEYLRPGSYY